MKYQVGLQVRAESDSNRIYLWLRSRSETGAGSWFAALLKRLKRLESDAPNCPRAKEAERFVDDLREAYFKTRRGRRYRLVFTIVGNEVRVLRIRAPGQRLLKIGDCDAI